VLDISGFLWGFCMKDIYELLRQKQLELSRLEIEVEALRVVALLLSDDQEPGNDNQLTSASSTAPPPPVRIPRAVNSIPQPAHAPEWEDSQGWP
jgi:hypothetical protein